MRHAHISSRLGRSCVFTCGIAIDAPLKHGLVPFSPTPSFQRNGDERPAAPDFGIGGAAAPHFSRITSSVLHHKTPISTEDFVIPGVRPRPVSAVPLEQATEAP